jgi:hypothetical protein
MVLIILRNILVVCALVHRVFLACELGNTCWFRCLRLTNGSVALRSTWDVLSRFGPNFHYLSQQLLETRELITFENLSIVVETH